MEGRADFVAGGHRLSGTLNFPRRINTAYFNAAVWRVYNDFVDAMSTSLHDLNITAPVKVLKADGGTMPLEYSRSFPVQTILSGPSASVMGALALQARPHDAQSTGDAQARPHDAIVLDLGGTTTDMAIFAHGTPLLETEGTRIGGKATLVRSIKTVSIGIGGDSLIKVDGSTVDVGPERIGPACCFGGSRPTLMDAFIYRGLSEGLSQTANEERYGELSAFADEGRSEKLFTELAAAHGVEPSPLAEQVINAATRKITGTVDTILRELREKPVYTIYEMLHRDPIRPQKLVLLGGPAPAFAQPLGEALGIEAEVVPFHGIANAVGAAVTRGTMEIELFADTERNLMTIPELNISTSIPDTYSLEQARTDAVRYLTSFIEEQGFGASADAIEITEAESFAMMDWMMRRGDNIRVKAQLRPAITTRIAPTKEDKYE
jgi:N-methylhydantoinase A/oxoprolinase/acetone carboxylase beta subunit